MPIALGSNLGMRHGPCGYLCGVEAMLAYGVVKIGQIWNVCLGIVWGHKWMDGMIGIARFDYLEGLSPGVCRRLLFIHVAMISIWILRLR